MFYSFFIIGKDETIINILLFNRKQVVKENGVKRIFAIRLIIDAAIENTARFKEASFQTRSRTMKMRACYFFGMESLIKLREAPF